jgi:hypothetical protein
MRKPRNTDVERAITLICKAVVQADIVTVKKMLCLAVGHPAAVSMSMTTARCARCGTQLHVSLEGWTDHGQGIWTLGKLTPTDLLLTTMPVTEKIVV